MRHKKVRSCSQTSEGRIFWSVPVWAGAAPVSSGNSSLAVYDVNARVSCCLSTLMTLSAICQFTGTVLNFTVWSSLPWHVNFIRSPIKRETHRNTTSRVFIDHNNESFQVVMICFDLKSGWITFDSNNLQPASCSCGLELHGRSVNTVTHVRDQTENKNVFHGTFYQFKLCFSRAEQRQRSLWCNKCRSSSCHLVSIWSFCWWRCLSSTLSSRQPAAPAALSLWNVWVQFSTRYMMDQWCDCRVDCC